MEEDKIKVLQVLIRLGASCFLELSALSGIHEEKKLRQIIINLEKENFVKISHQENTFEDIIVLNSGSLSKASRLVENFLK